MPWGRARGQVGAVRPGVVVEWRRVGGQGESRAAQMATALTINAGAEAAGRGQGLAV